MIRAKPIAPDVGHLFDDVELGGRIEIGLAAASGRPHTWSSRCVSVLQVDVLFLIFFFLFFWLGPTLVASLETPPGGVVVVGGDAARGDVPAPFLHGLAIQ